MVSYSKSPYKEQKFDFFFIFSETEKMIIELNFKINIEDEGNNQCLKERERTHTQTLIEIKFERGGVNERVLE